MTDALTIGAQQELKSITADVIMGCRTEQIILRKKIICTE